MLALFSKHLVEMMMLMMMMTMVINFFRLT